MKQREKILENTVKEQTAVLEEKNRQLREMDQAKSRFFANISHEFRTPLTLILGPLNDLLHEKKNQGIKKKLSLMQRNGIRLQRLIDQILDLVKLESKSLKPDLHTFNLDRLVCEVVDLFRPLASGRGLILALKTHTNSPESQPDGDREFEIIADKEKTEYILANLLSNAIKFTDEGGQITVDLRSTPGRVIVSVSDTGKGISEENQKYIFDRFYQVDKGDNRPAEGMGIGLALCKELMLLHKGNISVESEPGLGSTFTIEFLKGTDHLQDAGTDLSSSGGSSLSGSLMADVDLDTGRKRKWISPLAVNSTDELNSSSENRRKPTYSRDRTTLLIVEDHLDMREYVKSILIEDYKIMESENGEEALEVIHKNPPDLIIADIMMPVMDGLTFSRRLRETPLHRNIPILFLTAKAGDENEIEALGEGGDGYLSKPFNPNVLKARVNSLLCSQQRLREQLLSEALVNLKADSDHSDAIDTNPLHGVGANQPGTWTSELIRQMHTKLSDPNFGVDQLAELMHVSRSQLHRKTKKSTGRTPIQLLRETRLKKARQLIEAEESNYSEIAYACGFNSLSYFSRSYKTFFGYTPSAYQPEGAVKKAES